MAKEPWKCPHADCKRECSRRGNLRRHIIRLHGGEGEPVKNKSSADASNTISLSSKSHELSAIKDLYPRSRNGKEENNKKEQEEKTKCEVDLVDIAYSIFKRWKDKNDKLEEMRNYLLITTPEHPFLPFFLYTYSIMATCHLIMSCLNSVLHPCLLL
jgi:hypothetical protein